MQTDERVDVKTISLPGEIWEEIDQVKDGWDGNRSRAILRIFKEWKNFKAEQDELLLAVRNKLMTQVDSIEPSRAA